MKAKINTIKVPVTVYEEKKTVQLEMSQDQAALLFCLVGQMNKTREAVMTEKSITRYNPTFAYLLPNLNNSVPNLICDLYETLDKVLTR
jgi:hypothetical protein